ncbi:MAG: hypothetical protein KA138_01445 [Saprospiraceae bacterium]|jgi:hypothetical protein|nr:hypothetical protein [Saprospiraceae bacterium]
MKNSISITSMNNPFFNGFGLFIALIALLSINYACNDKNCAYDPTTNPEGCVLSSSLNLSTGIDPNGNVLAPGAGVVDPFWKLINIPPLFACNSTLLGSINGSAYVMNYANAGTSGWVNQPGSSTLAPVDLGTTNGFGCNNPMNSLGGTVPYVFERSFCVLQNTTVAFTFSFKGDDEIYFELVDNSNGNVLSTTVNTLYVFPAPAQTWTEAALPLPAGSYSLRGYLANRVSVVLGFSLVGNLTTVNGDLAISNNATGCCENNTISVLNILEEGCDGIFNGADQVGNGWTFNLLNASNNIVATGVSDINGNVFFAGLADGSYTVQIVPQGGWTPTSITIPVTVANNAVGIVEFFNCK